MSEPTNPMERRLVLRLLGYWRDLCGERDLPQRGDVDGRAITDMWDYCFVIEVKGAEPRFVHFGAWHADFHGADLTGRPLREVAPETLVERATGYLPEILRRRVPVTYGGELEERGGHRLLYRSIMLPLSDGADGIAAVLGGANCRIVPDPRAT